MLTSHVVCGLFGQAHRAEAESSGETAGRCLAVLRKIFPEVAVPAPVHAAASQWGSDPFARGSYRCACTFVLCYVVDLSQRKDCKIVVSGPIFFSFCCGNHVKYIYIRI